MPISRRHITKYRVGAAALLVALTIPLSIGSASAATTITVDTLALSKAGPGNSATNCVDSEATPKCSLSAALAAANAVPAGSGPVTISFAPGLTNPAANNTPTIRLSGSNTTAMRTTDASSGQVRAAASPLGYAFDVNASVPVTIDFGGTYGIDSPDTDLSAFLIQSPDVTITGLTVAQAGRNFFSIEAARTTILDSSCSNTSPIAPGGNISLEACVALLDGASDIALTSLNSNNAVHSAIVVDGSATVSGLAVSGGVLQNSGGFDGAGGGLMVRSGATLTNATFTGTRFADNAIADIQAGTGSTVDGLTVSNSTFTKDGSEPNGVVRSPAYGAIWFQGSATTVRNVNLGGNQFLAAAHGIQVTGTVTMSAVNVAGNLFDGGRYAYLDNGGETVTGMTFSGNTFRNGTAGHVLSFRNGSYTNLLVDRNAFIDIAGGPNTMIWAGKVGTNNVVSNNIVTVSSTNLTNASYTNTWFFYASMIATTASTPVGWSAVTNSIDGLKGSDAPVIFYGRGILPMAGNTFGANTSGTTTTASEGPSKQYFVANAGGGANGNTQTWRPANAIFDGSQVSFDVAPVTPVTGGYATAQPTPPVILHVYWTATDHAEEYLGAISGVGAAGNVSIATTHTSGFIRVQTQGAVGGTSQYSMSAQATLVLAAPVISGMSGDTLSGTGTPGATISVTDAAGATVCTATVDSSGNWSCTVPTTVPSGTEVTATQTLGTTTSPASATFAITRAPAPAPTPTPTPTPSPTPTPTPTPTPSPTPTPTPAPSAPTPTPTPAPPPSALAPEEEAPVTLSVTDVVAVAGPDSAIVTWDGSGNPEGTVYTVASIPEGGSCEVTITRCFMTGLSDGIGYSFSVSAEAPGAEPLAGVQSPVVVVGDDAVNLSLKLDTTTGADVSGRPSLVTARGLFPGSDVKLTVHSTPRSLGTFKARPDGTVSETVKLPGDLEPGSHRLIAEGTGVDGTPLSSEASFLITKDGEFGPGRYDPRDHPDATISTIAAGTAIAFGAAGFAMRRRPEVHKPWAPPRRSGDKPSLAMGQQEFRETSLERGDRSWTWISPWRRWYDRLSRELPNKLVHWSPLLARFFNDAAYLRAMFGTWSLITPAVGLALGIAAATQTGGQALPPTTALLVTIVALSMLDALIGVAAALAFTVAVLASGGVTDGPTLRCLVAIDIVFFSVILVVSSTRELRRERAGSNAEWFDRLADFAIGTPLAIWTAKAAFGSLPGLTGLDLPIGKVGYDVLGLIALVAVVRFGIETMAAHLYPRRLMVVAPDDIEDIASWRQWFTIVLELAVFAFFAASYMGNTPLLWLGVALVLAAATMDRWAHLLPDWPFLAKAIPGGIVAMLFYFALGKWSGAAFQNIVEDPRRVAEWGFVLLMIPGMLCALIAKTARNGDGWSLTWPARWWGIPTLAAVILLLGGFVALPWA